MEIKTEFLKVSPAYDKAVSKSKDIFKNKEEKVQRNISEDQDIKIFLRCSENVKNLVKYESYFDSYTILYNFLEDNFNLIGKRPIVRFRLIMKGYIHPLMFIPIISILIWIISLFFTSLIVKTVGTVLLLVILFVTFTVLFNSTRT